MINLLKPNDLKQIRAARVNVRLLRYIIGTVVTIIIVVGIYLVGYKLASDEYITAQTSNQAAKTQLIGYEPVKKSAATYRSNLEIAKKILGSEVSFSTFMTDTAKLLPANTILANISLSTKTPKTSQNGQSVTQLHARAKTYADVLALKTNLEKSNMFTGVRIESTSIPSSMKDLSGVELGYPVQATFDLVIKQYREATQ